MPAVTMIRGTVAAALLCASALVGMSAAAHADARDVSGGDRSDRAAEITAGVSHDDGKTATGELWYRYRRTIPQSTVMVGVVAEAEQSASMSIEATTADGDSCGSDSEYGGGAGVAPLGPGLVVGYSDPATPEEDCLGEELLFKVTPPEPGSPVTLTVWEEPEIANTSQLRSGFETDYPAWTAPSEDDSAVEANPGSSLANALSVDAGSHSSTIAPGEVQVYRVRLGWGDALSARVRTPAMTPDLADASVFSPTQLRVYNPLGMLSEDDPADDGDSGSIGSTNPESLAAGTVPVAPLNRFTGSTSFVPGDYYVVYAAQATSDGSTARFPYTLDLAVESDGDIAAPRYAGDLELLTGSESSSGDEDGSLPGTGILPGSGRTWAGLVLAALAAGCAVAGVGQLRRTRS